MNSSFKLRVQSIPLTIGPCVSLTLYLCWEGRKTVRVP